MKLKKRRVTLFGGICMFFALTQTNVCLAQEGNRDVPVTYSPSSEALARYRLQVIINGSGSIFDGTQELRKNTTVYELKYKEQKTFRVQADKGSYLKRIVYDGQDITKILKEDGTVTIEGMNYDSELVFTYEKTTGQTAEFLKSDSIPSGKKGTGKPKTGDDVDFGKHLFIVSAAGLTVIILLRNKKKADKPS